MTQKGTYCDLIEKAGCRLVRKHFALGDWLFPAQYEYEVEKHVYLRGAELNLPIPRLIDHSDKERYIDIEFVEGSYPEIPATSPELLTEVLSFIDAFSTVGFPKKVLPERMAGHTLSSYRREQLEYLTDDIPLREEFHSLYESVLDDTRVKSVPFDRILHNTFATDSGLVFYDFEWTVSAPIEFALARIAVECQSHASSSVIDRVQTQDLYSLFLIRFFLYGQDPDGIISHLESTDLSGVLVELLSLGQRIAASR